jgi:hypothetical protein
MIAHKMETNAVVSGGEEGEQVPCVAFIGKTDGLRDD